MLEHSTGRRARLSPASGNYQNGAHMRRFALRRKRTGRRRGTIMELRFDQNMGLSESELATSVLAHFAAELYHRRVFQGGFPELRSRGQSASAEQFRHRPARIGATPYGTPRSRREGEGVPLVRAKVQRSQPAGHQRAQRAEYAVQGELHDDFRQGYPRHRRRHYRR